MEEIPGQTYGKVMSTKTLENDFIEASISFTSTSIEFYRIIEQVLDKINRER
jgi:hypothetical protein